MMCGMDYGTNNANEAWPLCSVFLLVDWLTGWMDELIDFDSGLSGDIWDSLDF